MVRKLLDNNFSLLRGIQLAAFAKQAGGVNRRGGDEAAAKDGCHERSDKENQIKRKNGCPKPKVVRMVEHTKKKDEKEKWRRCISERWRR